MEFHTLTHVEGVELDADGRVVLTTTSKYDGTKQNTYDLVLLGTGFNEEMPALIKQFAEDAEIADIRADLMYRIDTGYSGPDDSLCFIQGVNEATHGIGDSLLSNQASRAANVATCIMDSTKSAAPHEGCIKPLNAMNMVFENGLHAQRLLPFPITPPFEASWCVVTPDTASTPHAHHEYELFVALEGEAIIVVDGQEMRFAKGDTAYFKPGSTHQVINRSGSDFVMYSIWWDDAMCLRQLAGNREREKLVS